MLRRERCKLKLGTFSQTWYLCWSLLRLQLYFWHQMGASFLLPTETARRLRTPKSVLISSHHHHLGTSTSTAAVASASCAKIFQTSVTCKSKVRSVPWLIGETIYSILKLVYYLLTLPTLAEYKKICDAY